MLISSSKTEGQEVGPSGASVAGFDQMLFMTHERDFYILTVSNKSPAVGMWACRNRGSKSFVNGNQTGQENRLLQVWGWQINYKRALSSHWFLLAKGLRCLERKPSSSDQARLSTVSPLLFQFTPVWTCLVKSHSFLLHLQVLSSYGFSLSL